MFYLLLGLSWAAENPFRSEIAPVTLSNSTQGTMDILIAIPQGFHLYKDMMSVQTRDTIGIAFQEPILPKGLFQPDPANPSMYREHYEETIMIHVPFSITGDGDHTSEVEVRYQGCKKGLCYKPAIDIHTFTVTTRTKKPMPSPGPHPSRNFSIWREFTVRYLSVF